MKSRGGKTSWTSVREGKKGRFNLLCRFEMCFRRLLQASTYRYSFKVCAENRIWAGIIGIVITALRTAARSLSP